MAQEFGIINKEEAYTYDELHFLKEKLLPLTNKSSQASLSEAFQKMEESLKNHKNSMAIFFMPQTSFNIFSLIQGDNSICKIQKGDIAALLSAFDLLSPEEKNEISVHLQKKVKTLNDYLQQGNTVCPTPIQADNITFKNF